MTPDGKPGQQRNHGIKGRAWKLRSTEAHTDRQVIHMHSELDQPGQEEVVQAQRPPGLRHEHHPVVMHLTKIGSLLVECGMDAFDQQSHAFGRDAFTLVLACPAAGRLFVLSLERCGNWISVRWSSSSASLVPARSVPAQLPRLPGPVAHRHG